MNTTAPSALDVSDPGLTAELGRILRAAGFTGETVRQALGVEGAVLSRAGDRPLHERRLEGVEPLGTLVKLFVLDQTVTPAAAEQALAPLSLEQVVALGLVERRDAAVRPLVRVVPHDEILIASDRRLEPGEPARADHVAGIHPPSVTLANLTVRRQVERALDVGTGCGIQAIHAARHAEHVVATDVNHRALGFARFNAQLNGVTNLEVLEGSFFEPVLGRSFDLVVSNPPYVVSPESEYLFRDSGMPGDAVSENVIRTTPSVLAEGGYATTLVSWVHAPSEHWAVPLRRWVEGSGCDAWLIHSGTDDPLTHAANWNRDVAERDQAAFGEALDRWRAYFERLGIEAIAHGAVILRRRDGTNWVREDELQQGRLSPAGDHILRVFAAQDLLARLKDDRELLGMRFALAERCRLEQSVVLERGNWVVEAVTLYLGEGLGFRAALERDLALLLAKLDGTRTLNEVVDELARTTGAGEIGRVEIVESAVNVARPLLAAAFSPGPIRGARACGAHDARGRRTAAARR